jgi:putative holliday junction resolvase
MRYLAIDYGIKRTGLAICDPAETIASPLVVIQAGGNKLLNKIVDTIKSENIEAVVIGLPLNMDDSQGPQAKLVLQFAEQLKKHTQLPIYFQDERLSTFEAEEKIAPADFTRKKKKQWLDAVAAAQILQTFLDEKNK